MNKVCEQNEYLYILCMKRSEFREVVFRRPG